MLWKSIPYIVAKLSKNNEPHKFQMHFLLLFLHYLVMFEKTATFVKVMVNTYLINKNTNLKQNSF